MRLPQPVASRRLLHRGEQSRAAHRVLPSRRGTRLGDMREPQFICRILLISRRYEVQKWRSGEFVQDANAIQEQGLPRRRHGQPNLDLLWRVTRRNISMPRRREQGLGNRFRQHVCDAPPNGSWLLRCQVLRKRRAARMPEGQVRAVSRRWLRVSEELRRSPLSSRRDWTVSSRLWNLLVLGMSKRMQWTWVVREWNVRVRPWHHGK